MINGNLISISIVLFCNPRDQIQKVIDSIRKSDVDYALFLVDNSPTKDFFSWFKPRENEKYWFLGKNVGFGAAHNLAIFESIRNNFNFRI